MRRRARRNAPGASSTITRRFTLPFLAIFPAMARLDAFFRVHTCSHMFSSLKHAFSSGKERVKKTIGAVETPSFVKSRTSSLPPPPDLTADPVLAVLAVGLPGHALLTSAQQKWRMMHAQRKALSQRRDAVDKAQNKFLAGVLGRSKAVKALHVHAQALLASTPVLLGALQGLTKDLQRISAIVHIAQKREGGSRDRRGRSKSIEVEQQELAHVECDIPVEENVALEDFLQSDDHDGHDGHDDGEFVQDDVQDDVQDVQPKLEKGGNLDQFMDEF